ncbi:TPA: CCP modules 3-12, with parts of CCP 2 and 13-like, partial [Bos taurus]
ITCDPPCIPNGVYRPELSKYRGQDKITYECKKGFFPEIRGTDATCTRDGWVPVPRCALGHHALRSRANPSIRPTVYELLWVRNEEGPSLSGSESLCMGGSQDIDLGHCHLEAQLGWRLCFQVGSLSWLCGEASVPDQLGVSADHLRDSYLSSGAVTPERGEEASTPGKPCSYPVIKHGRLYYSYRGYFPARVNQQFVYSCDHHFVPPSQRSWDHLTCTAEGWSPEEPCLRQCIFNYLENGHNQHPEEKYLQGETVRVRCYEGYSLQNDQNTMTCTESGWSPPPRCIRV